MRGSFYLKSSYSMLESLIPLKELFNNAQNEGYDFLALTDTKLHGLIELYDLAKEFKIKPVLGLAVKIVEPEPTLFLLYVKNTSGYKNLLKISLLIENKQNISLSDLINYQKGLIFVSGGYQSIIDQTVIYGNKDLASEIIKNYNEIFEDFYLGLSINYDIQKERSFEYLYNLASQKNIKTLLVHETAYLNKEDLEVYDVLIQISNRNNKVDINSNFKMLNKSVLDNIFTKFPKLLEDQKKLLKSIIFTLPKVKYTMPIYETKDNLSPENFLNDLAHTGLARRLKLNKITNYEPYVSRLNYELKIIDKMNFNNYFLIVYDLVRFAKQNKILVGPGRGSAAGSLTSYVLGITEVDPIKYNLMFERFLNPERTSMPDIDLDFPDNQRDLVINYVKEKYGINHIASITTFQTLQLNSSIRDVARIMGMDIGRVSGIINAARENRIDETDLEVLKVVNVASKIEGLYRQTGTHASGIILAHQNLTTEIPLQIGAFDFYQTQYDMKTLENLGLIKIDFLGLRNLTTITNVIKKISFKNIDLKTLNFNDKKTYELLSSGRTNGIFQMESEGMRRVLEKIRPESFEDIVATLALFRPGPMANIDLYVRRKKGEKFDYLHPSLEQILKPTYGIIIYQEQIMEIARTFAGYTLVEADLLRVGVSKKNQEILENERINFVNHSLKNGYTKEIANDIYDYIVKFADYGFNRSHSVSYAVLSYQMAYLKSNYFIIFMAELLNSVIGNKNQTITYINEINNNGYNLVLPDINYSTLSYEVINNKLMPPLTKIASIGQKTALEIINERTKNGNYLSYIDFKTRVKEIINETQLKNLIYAGTLDRFNHNRSTMIANMELKTAGFESFIKDFKINEIKEYSYIENQQFEESALSFNIKFNTYNLIKNNDKYKKYLTITSLNKLNYEKNYDVCGVVIDKNVIKTSNNQTMYFITFSDGLSQIELTVFNNNILDFDKIKLNEIVCLNIKKTKYKNQDSFIYNNTVNIK